MGTIDTISVCVDRETGTTTTRPGLSSVWSGLIHAMGRAMDRWRQRRDLHELTDDQLRDIGVTRQEARREAARPFWS